MEQSYDVVVIGAENGELLAAPSSPAGMPGYTGDVSAVYTLSVKRFGESLTVPIRASETVLTALERAGIDAPSRCRSGECGWCRSRMEKGEVFIPQGTDMRRMADAKNSYIHPCCSYPLGDISMEIWPE